MKESKVKLNDVKQFVPCCQSPLSKSGVSMSFNSCANVGCDWLQVYCMGGVSSKGVYDIKYLNYSTRHFKYVAEIYRRSELLGTIAFCPLSSILNPLGCLLKLDNRVLYVYNPFKLLKEILDGLKLNLINITRLDLFRDFNTFKYGYNPENLIRRFLNGEVIKSGQANFKVQGFTKYLPTFQYLRFGSNTSDFSAYLYNKYDELHNVKMKPYIIERAASLGVNTEKPFWRLEISLKSSQINVISKLTGEIQKCDINYFENLVNLSSFYYLAVNKYFRFYNNDGKQRKDRNRYLELFDEIDKTEKLVKFTNVLNSNRSDKVFIKHMECYNNEMRGVGIMESIRREEYLEDFLINHGLTSYYERKIKGATKRHKDNGKL